MDQLFTVKKTQIEMVRDRGYLIERDERKFLDEKVIDRIDEETGERYEEIVPEKMTEEMFINHLNSITSSRSSIRFLLTRFYQKDPNEVVKIDEQIFRIDEELFPIDEEIFSLEQQMLLRNEEIVLKNEEISRSNKGELERERKELERLRRDKNKLQKEKKELERDKKGLLVYYEGKASNQITTVSKSLVETFVQTALGMKVGYAILIVDSPLSSDANKILLALTTIRWQVFQDYELKYNVTKHIYVPLHELLSREETRQKLIQMKSNKSQLLIINIIDPIVRYYGWKAGDIIKIHRNDQAVSILSPKSYNYRVVVS